MTLNITPKNVFKGTNSDGSKFTVKEWDFGTLANLNMASFFVMFIGCVFLCSIAPFILFIICVLTISGRIQILNVLGILVSAYFLLDCYKGWIGISALNIICDESQMKFMIALNLTCFISHVIYLFLSKTLYEHSVGGKLVYILIMMALLIFSYRLVGQPLASKLGERVLFIYHNDKHRTMDEQEKHDTEIKKYENMTDEQIEEEADNKYYNDLKEHEGWSDEQINKDKEETRLREIENRKHYW